MLLIILYVLLIINRSQQHKTRLDSNIEIDA